MTIATFEKMKNCLSEAAILDNDEIAGWLRRELQAAHADRPRYDSPTQEPYIGFIDLASKEGSLNNMDVIISSHMYLTAELFDEHKNDAIIAFEDAYKSRRILSKRECMDLLDLYEDAIDTLTQLRPVHPDPEYLEEALKIADLGKKSVTKLASALGYNFSQEQHR